MKRFFYPLWLISLITLVFALQSPFTQHAHAVDDLEPSNRKISRDIVHKVNSGQGADLGRVIIQPVGEGDDSLDYSITDFGGSNLRRFKNFQVRIATMPAGAAAALARRSDVAYVSLNRDVRSLGHLSVTTGADEVRTVSGTNATGLDGTGIGIAVVDSGIDTTHKAFLDRSNNIRVVYSEDFTGEGRTDDPYGHGTHVAALAAGNGRISNAQYLGIAPNANIVNLRVLNSEGVGTTGSVLRALDWIASNRSLYNIRVVNLSLGMPAIDSY